MQKKFCDRCGGKDKNMVYITFEIIPSKFNRKHRDYCSRCFDFIAKVLDETFVERTE